MLSAGADAVKLSLISIYQILYEFQKLKLQTVVSPTNYMMKFALYPPAIALASSCSFSKTEQNRVFFQCYE
jgi:hypothetical protein